jgi:PemK-like, MazF-like toxin of type II toxin-antitoxin system
MKLNILKVKAPFLEVKGYKFRPVLQLNDIQDEHGNFQVAYITTKRPNDILRTDLVIDQDKPYFTKTGLMFTSYVRFSKIYTVSSETVESVIGEFPIRKNTEVEKILKIIFNLK